MTVPEMLSRMTSLELAEQMAYDTLAAEEASPMIARDLPPAQPGPRRLLNDAETDAMMRAHQRRARSEA